MADKEAALVALKTALEGITIANGYPLDIGIVSRQWETPDGIAVTSYPALLIEDDGPETVDFKTGGFADIEVEVNIWGYINNKDQVSTKLNELDSALAKVIHSEQTLGGAVAAVSIEPIKDRSGSKFNPYGFFVRPVKLFYEVQLSNGI